MKNARIRWFNRIKIDIFTLFVIIGCWILVDIFYNLHDYLTLSTLGYPDAKSFDINYWITEILTTIFAAIIAGSIIVFLLKDAHHKYPMWVTILYGTILIIFAAVFARAFAAIMSSSVLGEVPFSETFRQLGKLIFNDGFILVLMDWGTIVILTLIAIKINEKYGPGVFWEFLRGKYFRPKKEKRIFLFIDMTDSTTIAEKLGHRKQYNLLNDFFYDISLAILDTKGRIYQYAGDEILVSWMDSIDNKRNCVECISLAKTYIQARKDDYQKKYDLIPTFKAGIHAGEVTVGEIGSLKRELVYTGDTMNTTARIRSKCGDLNAETLCSQSFVEGIENGKIIFEEIGELPLKGKSQKVELYKILASPRHFD